MSTTTANTTATASTQEPVKNAPTEAQQAATQQKLEKMKAPVHEELLDHEAEAGNPHARIIAIALDESGMSQRFSRVFMIIVSVLTSWTDSSAYAFQWALDNLINPKTDQVILLNCRPVVTVPASYGLVYMDYGGVFGTNYEGAFSDLPPRKHLFDHQAAASSDKPSHPPPTIDWIDQVESENMVTSHKLLRIYGAQVLKTGVRYACHQALFLTLH
ncbi:hypothetical protein BC832DRAFT_486448 [Gaertneriomyces semiglobifer]|nr:hypothetical protein BC832DRAFT_486448 [Gaertneriomyces semiglobifer]